MLEALPATLLALKDVEAGSRGYVITGNRNYLKWLKRLTAEDGDQPQRLAKAEILI